MTLEFIEICGYRGVSTPQKLDLATPNEQPGSGLTYIVGPNNSGKSTVVEAMRALAQTNPPSFSEAVRNESADSRVSIRTSIRGFRDASLRTVEHGGSECVWDPAPPPAELRLFALSPRRAFSPYFSRSQPYDRINYMGSWGLPNQRAGVVDQFAARLFGIQEHREAFDAMLARVVVQPLDWYIEQGAQGGHYLKFAIRGSSHSSDGLGEGLVSLLMVIDALYDSSRHDTVVIDEPELSLHPTLQLRLRDLFVDLARDRQIVLATHSPFFVDWDALEAGAALFRARRTETGCEFRSLSKESVREIGGLRRNLNNPHVLGLDAATVFFLDDGIILVEGQEDVLAYKAIAQQLGMHLPGAFFGWGVGGADNMGTVAQVLSDLGFERVAGILDANKQDVYLKLADAFPHYRFVLSPADDVRSKPATEARPARPGMTDSSFQLRDEYRGSAEELLRRVTSAVEPR